MKATELFKDYRWLVFADKMTKEEYRDLQAGKDVKVSPELVRKYPLLFEGPVVKEKEVFKAEKKEVKDGDK